MPETSPDHLAEALITGVSDRLLRTVFGKETDTFNVLTLAALVASFDSASYFQNHMSRAFICQNDLHLLSMANAWRSVEGLILEFGVESGMTINHLASIAASYQVYGFDSFEGLPEDWRPGFSSGAFAQAVPDVASNVTLVKGRFERTMPTFRAAYDLPISLLHVDCDLYSSTKSIFDVFHDRLLPGSIIVFDKYFNYFGWRLQEYKSFK